MLGIDIFLWILFAVMVTGALGYDLFIANKKVHEISLREAGRWVLIWVSLALIFNTVVFFLKGSHKALEFLTAYIVEYSLSVDNIFVFVMLFAHFHISKLHQPRILKWGILGAVIMRAFFVVTGVALFNLFHWMIYVFGAMLIFAALKLFFHKEEEFNPEKNVVLRFFRFFFPVGHEMQGEKFFVKEAGRWVATPLFVVLILVEASDLIFALDSVPAVIAISQDLLIVYSSNIFAILGLRSLFFLLAGVMDLFKFLKMGLCVILMFVGIKLMISRVFHISTGISLGVIAGVLAVSIIASLLFKKKINLDS